MYRFVLSCLTMLGSLDSTLFRTRKESLHAGYVNGVKNVFRSRHTAFNSRLTIRKMLLMISTHQALHN